MLKLSQMTAVPETATKSEAKVNNYTFPREDEQNGTRATFDLSMIDASIVAKLEELLNEGVSTKSGKELYAILTFPRGSIKNAKGEVLHRVRMALTMFVKPRQ